MDTHQNLWLSTVINIYLLLFSTNKVVNQDILLKMSLTTPNFFYKKRKLTRLKEDNINQSFRAYLILEWS